jgi:hypothetical protein
MWTVGSALAIEFAKGDEATNRSMGSGLESLWMLQSHATLKHKSLALMITGHNLTDEV